MVRVRRLAAVVLAILGLLVGCSSDGERARLATPLRRGFIPGTAGGDDERYQPTDEDREEIRTLLKTRANALERGDRQAFLATVDPADDELVKQQTTLFDNLQLLPVESVSYSVDDGAGYPTARVEGATPSSARGDRASRLDVDTRPVSNTLEDTFVRRDEGWLLGAESVPGVPRRRRAAVEAVGGVGADRGRPSGRLLVLTDRDGDVAPQPLADDIADDIRFDAEALGIAPSYDVLVDATTVGDARR